MPKLRSQRERKRGRKFSRVPIQGDIPFCCLPGGTLVSFQVDSRVKSCELRDRLRDGGLIVLQVFGSGHGRTNGKGGRKWITARLDAPLIPSRH